MKKNFKITAILSTYTGVLFGTKENILTLKQKYIDAYGEELPVEGSDHV